jgi:hypothetical protein
VLFTAAEELCRGGLRVSIYNQQMCMLDPRLWPLARKSISDWKNEYLECCREVRRARALRRLFRLVQAQDQ